MKILTRVGMKPVSRKVKLHKMLFLLPNLITLSSLFCGFQAMIISLHAEADSALFAHAALLLVFSLFLDILDGRVARLTKTESAFGVQLDSFSDAVAFGLAPALLLYQWSLYRLPRAGLCVAFVFAACGILRLARFNVLATGVHGEPKKPGKYTVGLPIPGPAGLLVSLILANHAMQGPLRHEEYVVPLMILMGGLSLLMVSTVRFRSFKDVQRTVRTGLFVSFVLVSSVWVSFRTTPSFVLLCLLSCYLGLGLVESTWGLLHRLWAPSGPSTASVPPQEGPTLP